MAGVTEIKEPGFQEAFWNWWDSLDKNIKDRFKNYQEDAAHIYFYNAIWSKYNKFDKK
jgi:hypothetical protein